MGLLIKGTWDKVVDGLTFSGKVDSFRNWITKDGSSGFKAEAGRYHLYISLACPWACRTLIVRRLKNLESIISLSIVDPFLGENGWAFGERPDCTPDTINGYKYLYEIYARAKADYTGRVSVPVLWDKQEKTIVSNESADIIRMFNSEFNNLTGSELDLYPENLREAIDEINERVFSFVNLGVYKCGFATSQQHYDKAFDELFQELDQLETLLGKQHYLVGDQIAEADWRLFTTLIRFDTVYYVHFKCNLRRISDYPNLHKYLSELYEYHGIKDTVNFTQIKEHYYISHKHLNPSGIVPRGPELNFSV